MQDKPIIFQTIRRQESDVPDPLIGHEHFVIG